MRIPKKPPSEEEIRQLFIQNPDINALDGLKHYFSIVNTNYLHWDELQVDDRFKGVDLKLLWSYIKFFRGFSNRPIKLNGVTLQYVQTPQIEKALHDLDIRVGGKIGLEAQMPGPELQKKYLVNSLMEEAIASSQLEGAATSRVAAKKMLRENRKPRNHSEQMIVNNYVTMMYVKENVVTNQKLTLGFIKEIHRKITKDTLENKEYEGTFRTDNEVKVYAKGEDQIVYDPPDYKKINQLLEQVCNFVNNADSDSYYLHPFVKAIVLHYMIGYIHPFNDGNGRTARALFYWYLMAQKYDYLEYVAVSTAIKNASAQYARAYLYSETDNNDVTYFVKFNLRALDIAVTSFENYISKTKAENRKMFEIIQQNPKLNFRQADILISMSKDERPMTILEMQERYHITYETARTDLLGLVKQGYLQTFSKGKQFIFRLDKDKCMHAGAFNSPKQ
ncbi:MAG: Fic family protein [Candidatus Micrarchaeota archaeon]